MSFKKKKKGGMWPFTFIHKGIIHFHSIKKFCKLKYTFSDNPMIIMQNEDQNVLHVIVL